ncbi:unnamed protein product, partial [Laminaria digitata]
ETQRETVSRSGAVAGKSGKDSESAIDRSWRRRTGYGPGQKTTTTTMRKMKVASRAISGNRLAPSVRQRSPLATRSCAVLAGLMSCFPPRLPGGSHSARKVRDRRGGLSGLSALSRGHQSQQVAWFQ